MIQHIKAVCLNSLTVGWSYCLALAGAGLQVVDSVADVLGDPGFREQIGSAVGDPKTTGRILLGISVITIVARLRSLRKAD
jgi:hypothetical protein